METLAASSLHFSLMRWPALRHSPLEHQQGTLSCGVQAPCTLCPPCPAAGSILGTGRASCLSTHKLPAPFASFLAGQLFLNSKWSFPSVFASSLLLRGVSAAPGTHLQSTHLPGRPGSQGSRLRSSRVGEGRSERGGSGEGRPIPALPGKAAAGPAP